MQYVLIAVPFLLLAAIAGLPLATLVRARARTRPARPARVRRPPKSKLHVVTRSQMDEDLQDLIRRRP
jgi:hypothetical protein